SGHPIRTPSRIHFGKLPRLAPIQRRISWISVGVDHSRRPGAAHRDLAVSNIQNVDCRGGLRFAHRNDQPDLCNAPQGSRRPSGQSLTWVSREIRTKRRRSKFPFLDKEGWLRALIKSGEATFLASRRGGWISHRLSDVERTNPSAHSYGGFAAFIDV